MLYSTELLHFAISANRLLAITKPLLYSDVSSADLDSSSKPASQLFTTAVTRVVVLVAFAVRFAFVVPYFWGETGRRHGK